MSKISQLYRNAAPFSIIFSVVISVLFIVTVAQAATTIGSNISTDGTVNMTGLSTFGNASSTVFSVLNNAYFGATATSAFAAATVRTDVWKH